jgi:hypothetical protein
VVIAHSHGFVAALRQTAAILSLRLLPFAVYALAAPRWTLARRLSWAVVYLATAGLAWWLGASSTLVVIAGAAAYYLVASVGLSRLGRWLSSGELSRPGMFAVGFFVCLVLPGALLPGIGMTVYLVVGWDLMLSSYSYNVETSFEGARRPPLVEALFFLLVNPTLVYTVRGKRVSDGGGLSGLGRAAGGALLVLGNIAVTEAVVGYLRQRRASTSSPVELMLLGAAFGGARFLELYGAHSALASLQIGLMRHIGWTVPERYRYPAAATSPMDFWRRWNTYVRIWLEAYVFLPLARRIARTTHRRWGAVAAAAATLVASGLLHVAFVFAGRQSFAGTSLNLFVAAGIAIAAWELTGGVVRAVRGGLDGREGRWFDLVTRVTGRACMAAVLIGAALAWG